MIILGAKGFAKEVLAVLYQQLQPEKSIYFYDDVSSDLKDNLFDKFPILKSLDEVRLVLKEDSEFVLGLGYPKLRAQFAEKFEKLGGSLQKVISPKAIIGEFGVEIGQGVCIMSGTVITSDIRIGKGVLLNLNCTVGHDSIIEDFVECSPGVHLSGNVEIGAFTSIGTGAVLLPKIKIGKNCVIGAGSVIRENVPDNCLVVGVPGKVIKKF